MPTLNPYATTQTPTGAPTTATQPSYSYTGAPQETTNQTSGNPPNYARTPTTNTPGSNGLGTLKQGYVETSNVNVVEELVQMIQTQRAYELNSKSIQTSDQMLQKLASL